MDYAAYRDRSKAWVSNLKRDGKLAPPALLPDGLIDFELADEMLGLNLDPAMSRKPGGVGNHGGRGAGAVLSYDDGRRRKAHADAELAEMELARRRAQLVDRASVETAGREIGVLCQQILDANGKRVVDAVRGAPTAAEALKAWQVQSRAILTQIGQEAARAIERLQRDEAS